MQFPQAPQRPPYFPRLVRDNWVNVGKEEVLPMPPAAHHHLPVRVHDVAVAVADPVGLGDGRVFAQILCGNATGGTLSLNQGGAPEPLKRTSAPLLVT